MRKSYGSRDQPIVIDDVDDDDIDGKISSLSSVKEEEDAAHAWVLERMGFKVSQDTI
jgi:hypothetical protein